MTLLPSGVLLLFLLTFTETVPVEGGAQNLSFMLMISQGGGAGDWSHFIPAIDLALDKINEDGTILPQYTIQHHEVPDAMCNPNLAVNKFIENFIACGNNGNDVLIIGDICSVATQQVAALSSFWNILHISPYSASPLLSLSTTYKTFVRLVPPENEIAPGIVALMGAFGWKHLAIISEEHELFTLTRESIFKSIKVNSSLSVIHSVSYPLNSSPEQAVDSLLASSGRVVFLNSYSGPGKEVLCQVYRKAKSRIHEYAWIIFGWYPQNVWEEEFVKGRMYKAYNDCSPGELKQMFNRAIIVARYPYFDKQDDTVLVGNITKQQYIWEYIEKCKTIFGNDSARSKKCASHSGEVNSLVVDSAHGYDAMWLAARALNATENIVHFRNLSRERSHNITFSMYNHCINDTFHGASGYVKFLQNGDRVTQLSFYQYVPSSDQKDSNPLVRQFIGSYQEGTLDIKSFDELFPDYKPITHTRETVHTALLVCYSVLAFIGIIFAVVCMVFIIVFREKMIVKLSSPPLSAVSIVGIMLLFLLVVVLGIDEGVTSLETESAFCVVNLWIGVIAFTLVYGAMLSKAFRVYYIFKNIKVSKQKQTHTVQDWHMFLLIGVLLAVDTLFLTVVTAVNRSRLRAEMKETIPPDGRLPALHSQCVSSASDIWLPILAVYKIIEVVLSIVFSFEVRKIQVKGLIDSRMITFSVYIVVVAAIIVPVVVVLSSQPNVRYGVLGAVCLVASTTLLCLNYIPKMYGLYKNPNGEINLNLNTVTRSMTRDASKVHAASTPGDKKSTIMPPPITVNNTSDHEWIT